MHHFTNELARKDSGGSSNLSYFLSEQQHLMRDKRKKENLRPASLWPRLKPPQPKIIITKIIILK